MSEVCLAQGAIELPQRRWLAILGNRTAVNFTAAAVVTADGHAEDVTPGKNWHFWFLSSMRASRCALALGSPLYRCSYG